MQLNHILVTTDLSPESLRALAPVGEFARSSGARVTLLNVVKDLMVVPHAEALAPSLTPADMEQHVARARSALEDLRGSLGEGIEVAVEALPAVDVARTVAAWADEHQVDLIALSTHGRTGFRHLVLGSVAEAVVRHAHVPVLCFPPEREARGQAR